jgi:hypothetical protein
MSNFDYWLIGAMFVLFAINTIVQFKLGFSNGAKGGYAVGMYHAVSWLMKNQELECENIKTGEKASAADVVAFIIRSKSFEQNSITDKDDLKKIAEASEDLD